MKGYTADAAVVAQLPKVLGAEAEERGAVELRVAADVIVDLGRELPAVRSNQNSGAR